MSALSIKVFGLVLVRDVERLLIALTIFFAAFVLCLPVPPNEDIAQLYPLWANRITIGNILLHELLFICWFLFYGGRSLASFFLTPRYPARQAAICLIILAIWCGIMSLSAPMLEQDIGRTLRLLLNAALLLAAVRWARNSPVHSLLVLVLGFFSGTVINLLISFEYPLIVNGVMRLSGQNTPGVAMAVAIHLSAWLFIRGKRREQLFSLLVVPVFAAACTISFSRIGWFVGAFGLLAWLYVLYFSQPYNPEQRRGIRIIRCCLTPLLIIGLLIAPTTKYGQIAAQWGMGLIEQKGSYDGQGDGERLSYLKGTLEIVSKHPFGVGYSGFYKSYVLTKSYRSPEAAEESSPLEANPHATFLWYASTGGIPAAFISILSFIMLLNSMRVGLKATLSKDGLVLFALIAPGFLLMGLTVPYLFNGTIFIIPIAIAAGWGWLRLSEHPQSVTNT